MVFFQEIGLKKGFLELRKSKSNFLNLRKTKSISLNLKSLFENPPVLP